MNTPSALRISIAACLPLLGTLGACGGDDDAVAGPKLSETYRRLGDSLGPSLARLKSSATSPAAIAAAELGGVLEYDFSDGAGIGGNIGAGIRYYF